MRNSKLHTRAGNRCVPNPERQSKKFNFPATLTGKYFIQCPFIDKVVKVNIKKAK